MSHKTKTLQYQLSNGNWMDCGDRTDEFLANAERFISNHPNKSVFLGKYATIQERLDAEKNVCTGSDWYEEIRYKPAPRPDQQVELVKCSCGHSVPRSLMMNASMGTSCPDCYDRMSE